MKNPNFEGWLSWSFNDVPYGIRQTKDCQYKFIVNKKVSKPLMSYKDALFYNAKMTREYYDGKFDVLLSGGIDSEVVVRTYKELGISHNTYIFKYENDYNKRDVDSAVSIAESLNIPYKVIDFKLEKFFENDAWDLFKKSKCIRAARLVHLRFCELVDNIPVMGDAEPYWYRELGKDYSKKSTWKFPMNESNHNCSLYMHSIGKENVCDWYEFTPDLVRSFNEHPLIKQLINDELTGKLSNWTSRIPMHKEIWPDIQPKIKLTGFESNNFTGEYPEFLIKLQEAVTEEIGNGDEYWLNYEEVSSIFC